ncbi:C-type mannose receptor 2-like [Hoplias malabaricus]|uniref:C-type mannose receptor 2-like n=1 Tax=Hoplias malabaricus TaxID=27720 RepID=UPI003461C28C
MDKRLILVLLISVSVGHFSTSSALMKYYYYFVNQNLTWVKAQSYCRQHYTDLVTVDNMKEMVRIRDGLAPKYNGSSWIGLSKIPPRRWGWSSGDALDYINWHAPEPDNGDYDGICGGVFKQFTGWIDVDCTELITFVCYSELKKTFIHIKTQVTWMNAQTYCRKYYTDLATIHSEEENQEVLALLGSGDYAWIGLIFDNWKWSDQQSSSFRNWGQGQPWSPTGNANCATMLMVWGGQWDDTQCDSQLPFICYKVPRRSQRLKITFSGEIDLNDAALKTAILKKTEEMLRTQGMSNDTTLSWSETNGNIFILQ